jgi:pimeloyl-ACP methyl ester carboxylesterase
MNKEFANIFGNKIAFLHKGDSEQKLVFLHGNSQSTKIWEKQFESDLFNAFELYAFDLPGHGDSFRSNNPEEDYNLKNVNNMILNFIKKMGIKNPILIGHSLGGHLLMEICPQIDSLKGLCIFGAPPIKIPADFQMASLPSNEMMLAFKNELTSVEAKLLANLFFNNTTPGFVIDDIKNTDGNFRDMVTKSLAMGILQDEYSIVKNLGNKVAIIHGEKDRLINLDFLKKLDLEIWNSRVNIIPHASHCPQYEQPYMFNNILKQFIDSRY